MADDIYGVIVRPILTERSTILKEKFNQYIFQTPCSANKIQIKQAVEEIFKVKVRGVRTMIVPGKMRRRGRIEGYKPDWKKAIVTLAKGEKIDIANQTA